MKKLLYTTLVIAPTLALAQTNGSPTLSNLQILLNSIQNLVKLALPIVIGLALLAFFWGLMKFIFSQGNEESKADGKKIMIYGIVALFVMVSVWGLVNFIGGTLGIGQGGTAPVPTVNGL